MFFSLVRTQKSGIFGRNSEKLWILDYADESSVMLKRNFVDYACGEDYLVGKKQGDVSLSGFISANWRTAALLLLYQHQYLL